jgi:hypothetical protein
MPPKVEEQAPDVLTGFNHAVVRLRGRTSSTGQVTGPGPGPVPNALLRAMLPGHFADVSGGDYDHDSHANTKHRLHCPV